MICHNISFVILYVVRHQLIMSGANKCNAIIIDGFDKQEEMELQQGAITESTTCFAMCSFGPCCDRNSEASSTNTQYSELVL